MNALIDYPASGPVADASAIQFTIIYDEFLSGARAKQFAERLAEQIGCTCRLSESLWRSDLFDRPTIAGAAACATAECDYLIVSLRGDHVLPPAARRWIEAVLDGAAGHLACVIALLGCDDGKPSVGDGSRDYLRAVCAANHVEFFSHSGMPSAQGEVTDFREMPVSAVDFSVRPRMPAPLDE
jgi:hypothetical protein